MTGAFCTGGGRNMKPLIIIDAGHGGADPGASGNAMLEKHYTLLISIYQQERFEELGMPVLLTRDSDVTLGNVQRAELVKNSRAKCCISNHLNGVVNTSAQGVEVIHSIHNDGKLAHAIVESLASEGIPKRPTPVFCKSHPHDTKKDYYYMHRWTGNVQTNIIEYDFITNVHGAQRIKENWQRYAEAIVRVYCNYLGYPYRLLKPDGEKKEMVQAEKKIIEIDLHGKPLEVEGLFFGNRNYIPVNFFRNTGKTVELNMQTGKIEINYK